MDNFDEEFIGVLKEMGATQIQTTEYRLQFTRKGVTVVLQAYCCNDDTADLEGWVEDPRG